MINKSGVLPSPIDIRDHAAVDILARVPKLPLSIRHDHKFKVRNQGMFGTCVGKAGSGVMSAFGEETGLERRKSSLFLYTRCKQLDGIPHLEGTYVRTALKVLHKEGICTHRTLPYKLLTDIHKLPKLTPRMFKEARRYRIESYARADNYHDIKKALAKGYPTIAVILVDDNFIYYRDGVWGPAKPEFYGYHAIILCGYEPLIIRAVNSWGKSWGEEGFFWIRNVDLVRPTLIEAWIVEPKKKDNGGKKMFWTEKGFWVALVGVAVPLLNHFLGWGLEAGMVIATILPAIAYILGVSWKDAEIEKAELAIDLEMVRRGVYDE